MQELFDAMTRVNEFGVYKGVHVSWSVAERTGPIARYADCISDYAHMDDDLRSYAEWRLNRYFTKDEAFALECYLQKRYGETAQTIIEKVSPPISVDTIPFDGIPLSMNFGPGLLLIWERSDYNLPFKVEGFYDTRFSDGVFLLTSEKN